jgi:hypothetical protein
MPKMNVPPVLSKELVRGRSTLSRKQMKWVLRRTRDPQWKDMPREPADIHMKAKTPEGDEVKLDMHVDAPKKLPQRAERTDFSGSVYVKPHARRKR